LKYSLIILFIAVILLLHKESQAQFFPRFSIAGGPTIGWQLQNTDDLNAEMRKIGIPEFSNDGFLVLGGGGFVELPIKSLNWLRIGGSGTGFTEKNTVQDGDKTKTVYYSYGAGGISLDYIFRLGKKFDMTLGTFISTGTLTIEMYQNTPGYGNWNQIFGELQNGSSSENLSRTLSVRFWSAQPQIGFGFFLMDYLYAKLNAGYLFSTNNDWEVDDGIPVSNAPSGIKADGFNVNFGLNFGLFTK